MKSFIIAAALAGLAATTPLSAQGRIIPTNRTNQTNCSYNGSTVGSIVFGRNGSNCSNGSSNNRVDGQWYQIGQDGNGNVIYERRVQDGNGNIIVQRARQDAYGNMSIISSQNVGNNGSYNNGSRNNGSWNNGSRASRRRGNDGDRDDQGNYSRRSNGGYNRGNGGYDRNDGSYNSNDGRYDRNNATYNRKDGDDDQRGNAEHKDKGRGKGKKDRD